MPLTGLLLLSLSGLGGCIHHHYSSPSPDVHARKGGPPPHAPAHGHRRKHHDGIELVYDSEIGVYVVVGRSHHYHDGRSYFRWIGGEWMMSVRMDDGWVAVGSTDVPTRLAARHGKHHGRGGSHGHVKSNGKAIKPGHGHGKAHPAKHGHK